MTKEYTHTQIGYGLLIICSALMAVIIILNFITDFHPAGLIGLLVMPILLGLFATLTVHVDHEMITLHFALGVIYKGFRLQEIERVRAVRNPWYYGLGIRLTPRGWLFNVSGLSAVELQMKNGKRYRIGTDDPQGLENAIDNALRAL